jgi:hypothetical protein
MCNKHLLLRPQVILLLLPVLQSWCRGSMQHAHAGNTASHITTCMLRLHCCCCCCCCCYPWCRRGVEAAAAGNSSLAEKAFDCLATASAVDLLLLLPADVVLRLRLQVIRDWLRRLWAKVYELAWSTNICRHRHW